MKSLRQGEPVEHDRHDAAAQNADDRTEDGLLGKRACDRRPRPVADQQDLDQHDGEEHGERIIGAGFDFERRADPRTQPQAAGMDQEEHRGRIGRADHRADQECLEPADAERVFGDRRG